MWVFLSLIAIFVSLVYTWLTWNIEYWRKRNVIGPDSHLLVGSFPKAFMQKLNMVYEVDVAYRKFRHQSPYFGFFMGRKPKLMITDPDIVKQVMITNFNSFHDNAIPVIIDKETDPLLVRNPFFLQGEEWKNKRSEMTPAFTNIRIKNMYPIMEHVAKKMTSYLRTKLDSNPDEIDLIDLGSRFTADAVSNSIFGVDAKALTGEYSEILQNGSSIFNNKISSIMYFTFAQLFPCIQSLWRMSAISKPVERFFENLTQEAIKIRSENGIAREDFLNYFIQLKQKKELKDIEIAGHALTFFADGYETSGMVIANTLHQLADHPDVQDKLRKEIESALTASESISYEQIIDLEYLEQVINESLRISPAVGFANKVCTEDFTLNDYKGQKLVVEKGTVVVIPTYSLHHDEEHYRNPEAFDPDRFSVENGGLKAYKDKGVFLSFGDGPRICVGMKYGMLQIKVAIVEIVRNFELKSNSNTQLATVFDPTNFLPTQVGGLYKKLKCKINKI